MATDSSQEIPCSKYNFFRNTNLLINLKKNKKTIFASLLIIGLISLNIYFGVLATSQQSLLNNQQTKHPGEISNLNVGIMEDMMHLKNNITYLKNIVNNQVHHEQFTRATDNISSNFNAVNAEVTKQIENFQNISFILNEFDRHKKTLEFNISTIFSLFLSRAEVISSNKNISASLYIARAIFILCSWPPDKRLSVCEISVSYLSDKSCINSSALAAIAALIILS